MIKPELYHKTVGILYDAYFNDTLQHGWCCACVVGNLVAANCGYKIINSGPGYKWSNGVDPIALGWGTVFHSRNNMGQLIAPGNYMGVAKEQIDSTGYSWEELATIEAAFETAPRDRNNEERMFNGLAAVLEVLKQIHQVTDEDLLISNNKRFKDHYNKRIQVCKV